MCCGVSCGDAWYYGAFWGSFCCFVYVNRERWKNGSEEMSEEEIALGKRKEGSIGSLKSISGPVTCVSDLSRRI